MVTPGLVELVLEVDVERFRAALAAAVEVVERHRPALEALLRQQRRAELRRIHTAYRARRRGRW